MAMTSHTLGSAIVVVHPSRQDPFWRKPNNWDWSRGQRGVNQLAASISDECRGVFRCLAHIMYSIGQPGRASSMISAG